jgi:Zn-dependent protease/CBS domain-containing protein
MAWSWRLGRVAGIPIFVHWTFLVLLVWLLIEGVARGQSPAQAAEGVGFVLALFGCVVLHELGHALTARRFGIPTADITLLPIGGLARLQRMPDKPWQELLVALAGPAVNVVIAAALWAAGVTVPAGLGATGRVVEVGFWPELMLVNVMLVVFNLLPAFPMDGGRVLRALLAMKMEYARATRLAASIGQVVAIGFALLGLWSHNPFLVLIALFVWIGAEAEASMVEERVVLRGVPVRAAMLTDFQTLSPHDTLGYATDLLLAGAQHDFPVLDHDRPAGLLTRADLLAGLSRGGREAPVADFLRPGPEPVEADSPLFAAVARLRESGTPCVPVVEHGHTVGLLTLENVGEYLMVRTALADPRAATTARTA